MRKQKRNEAQKRVYSSNRLNVDTRRESHIEYTQFSEKSHLHLTMSVSAKASAQRRQQKAFIISYERAKLNRDHDSIEIVWIKYMTTYKIVVVEFIDSKNRYGIYAFRAHLTIEREKSERFRKFFKWFAQKSKSNTCFIRIMTMTLQLE